MWSPTNRRDFLRRLGGLSTLAASAPLLAACGFKPMYGGQAGHQVTRYLAGVEVARIADRKGQILRNELERRMERSGGGGSARKRFVLTCKIKETYEELGLSKDDYNTRADLTMSVTFSLASNGRSLMSGTSEGTVAYNILDQQYATVVSKDNARERALTLIANDITNRLSAYFSRNANSPELQSSAPLSSTGSGSQGVAGGVR